MALAIKDLPTQEQMVRNIVGTFYTATEFDRQNGVEWYDKTRELCQDVADTYDYPLDNVVGAYAVISPSLNKEQNDVQIYSCAMFHRAQWPIENWYRIGTYGRRNREKAQRCLDGDLSAVRGPKVTRFYQSILGVETEPVVDRWALRVAFNEPGLAEEMAVPGNETVYNMVKDAYIAAAEYCGASPRDVQSTTWEVFRNKYFRMSPANVERNLKKGGAA